MTKAKNVVVIFCARAVSQLETWDYKPLPGGPAVTFKGPAGNLARPRYTFRQRGQTGKGVSDMIPHLGWQRDYREPLRCWEQAMQVIETVETFVRREGH